MPVFVHDDHRDRELARLRAKLERLTDAAERLLSLYDLRRLTGGFSGLTGGSFHRRAVELLRIAVAESGRVDQ